MKDTSIYFVIGAAVGVSLSLLVSAVYQSTVPQEETTSVNIAPQLDEIQQAIATANNNTLQLQHLFEQHLNMLSSTPVNASPRAATHQSDELVSDADSATSEQMLDSSGTFEQFLSQLEHTQNNAVVSRPTNEPPPTAEQIEHYHDIENRLYAAVNDTSADLSELLIMADKLTFSQRNELTSKAMQMIQRGELTVQQFSRKK